MQTPKIEIQLPNIYVSQDIESVSEFYGQKLNLF
jgi:hypothetical protein